MNNEDAHFSTQNLVGGGDLWHWKPNLIAFLVFSVLETRRQYKLTINLGIVKFLKKIIKQFLNYREICRRGPNCIKKL